MINWDNTNAIFLKNYRFDWVFDSLWLNKFVNKFVKHGNKKVVEKHITKAFLTIQRETHCNPTHILLHSMLALKPFVWLEKRIKPLRKRKRKIMLIPNPITPRKQTIISLNWLVSLILFQKKWTRLSSQQQKKKTRSKKKTFKDRFHIALKNQHLNNLIVEKFKNIVETNSEELIRRKTFHYLKVTNNRVFVHYRWS